MGIIDIAGLHAPGQGGHAGMDCWREGGCVDVVLQNDHLSTSASCQVSRTRQLPKLTQPSTAHVVGWHQLSCQLLKMSLQQMCSRQSS